MRRRRSRQRKVTITPELIELFRKALPHERALMRDVRRDKRKLTDEQFEEAHAAVMAFNLAAGVEPWQRSPLHPRTDLPEMQAALLVHLDEAERKAWERYANKVRKEYEAWWAEYQAAEKRIAKRYEDDTPRPEPALRFAKGWG